MKIGGKEITIVIAVMTIIIASLQIYKQLKTT